LNAYLIRIVGSKLLRTRLSDMNHVHGAHHGAVARPGSHIAGGTVKGARVQDTDARLDLTVTRPQALRIMKEYKELRSDALAGLDLRRKLCEGVVSNNFFFNSPHDNACVFIRLLRDAVPHVYLIPDSTDAFHMCASRAPRAAALVCN
jgi:hypothetical protein